MRIAVTGTPGVGKTSACAFVKSMRVVHVSELIEESGLTTGYDSRRKTKIVDTVKLAKEVDKVCGDMLIEGHLSHMLHPEIAVVLRCSPSVLEKRLRTKGWSEEKVRENVEAEAVDVILIDAIETVPTVLEIDTTDKKPAKVGAAIEEIISGERKKYRAGGVDWSQEVLSWF
jgi:adenylate kinase